MQDPVQNSPSTGPSSALPRKSSPNTGLPATYPRKSSPSKPKNANFGVFSARWANFFALAPTIGARRANFFAHKTQPRGDDETNNTTAATDAGHRETAITTAHPSTATAETDNTSATEIRTKNTHLSPAKATPVSTPHGNERAKVPPVSDNRTPGLRAPTTPPAGIYAPTPQKNRMQFD